MVSGPYPAIGAVLCGSLGNSRGRDAHRFVAFPVGKGARAADSPSRFLGDKSPTQKVGGELARPMGHWILNPARH